MGNNIQKQFHDQFPDVEYSPSKINFELKYKNETSWTNCEITYIEDNGNYYAYNDDGKWIHGTDAIDYLMKFLYPDSDLYRKLALNKII